MKQCELCAKCAVMGGTRKKLRGKYNPTNWSKKQPNLQQTRDAAGKKVTACTSCIRTLAKAK